MRRGFKHQLAQLPLLQSLSLSLEWGAGADAGLHTSKSSVIARDIWIPWVPLCLPQRNLLSASFLDQMLIHATGSSLHWQHQEHYRILCCLVCPLSSVPQKNLCLHHAHSDAKILSKHAAHATYNLGIYPLQYMPQKNLLSASCRFRR